MKYKFKIDTAKICRLAFSGKEAVKIIKENVQQNNFKRSNIKLILMDYNMLGMDGPEATLLIR